MSGHEEIPQTVNPAVSNEAALGLRTIWETIEFVTQDESERPVEIGFWMEAEQALEMTQEMLTDLSHQGLKPIKHYLKHYGRCDDSTEAEAAAEAIMAAIDG